MLIVQKFGGSSVADKEKIFNVANRIGEQYEKGNKIVVVLSAQGNTTDILLKKANEINPDANKRELDMLLTTGEQQSVAFMSMALQKLGYPAISLNAAQVGIHSSSAYGKARIKKIDCNRIISELDKNNIVLIAGFQGINKFGDITTLGRGASDTTAVALAAVLSANFCEIYTDVDGIYSGDPRMIKHAKKIKEIGYDEMLELASLGANVLHNRSIEIAKKFNVALIVRSSISKESGTVVKGVSKLENTLIRGVAIDEDVARISIVGLEDKPGISFKIFSLMAKENITVDLIIQSIGRNTTKDISFAVDKSELKRTIEILEENKDYITYDYLKFEEKIAKLSIIGAGIASNTWFASKMFEALYRANVNIQMIASSEIKISVLIDIEDIVKAANAVHDKFLSENLIQE